MTETLLQNDAYKVIDGFMMNTITRFVLYRADYKSTEMRISGGVFYEMILPKNQEVVIPESVKVIRNLAFHGCAALKEVVYEGKSATSHSTERHGNHLQGQAEDRHEKFAHNEFQNRAPRDNPQNDKGGRLSQHERPFGRLQAEAGFLETVPGDNQPRFGIPARQVAAPIEYDSFKKGFYYSNRDYRPDFENL